jgi:hypothetical protein
MANWGGILAGAAVGAGDAVQGMARGNIEDERKLAMSRELDKMEEMRQTRIAEAAEARRREGRQADFEQNQANAPAALQTEIARERGVGAAQADLKREGLLANNDPATLKAMKNVANASRPDAQYSPETYADAEIKKMALGFEKKRQALLSEREDVVNGDMKGDVRAQSLKKIDANLAALDIARMGKKVDETNTVQREKETYVRDPNDPTLVLSKETEKSTEKRRAPPMTHNATATGDPAAGKAHAEARAAIARGADPQAINARLKSLGFPTL